MTTLLLVRHGETVDNANHIMQGQTDGELNANGIRQARMLRDQMRDECIGAFVSSDLKRAIDTCRIIAEPHGMAGNIVITPLLRERDWGSFTGEYIPDLQDRDWPDDIETLERLKSRATNFLTFVRTFYAGKTVLAVGHGIINKAVQSVFFNKPMSDVPRMTNAEVRVLRLQ